jgi:hypothetical protein
VRGPSEDRSHRNSSDSHSRERAPRKFRHALYLPE